MVIRNPNTGTSTGRGVFVASLVLGGLSLILQVVGHATPGWLTMYVKLPSVKEYDISMGLWVVNYCIDRVCGSKSIDEFGGGFFTGASMGIDSTMDEYRAETIIGIVLMLFVLICVMKLVCCRARGVQSNDRVLLIVTSVAAALSAFMAILASVKWGAKVADAHKRLGPLSPYLIPYSPFITGTGGILALVLFIILAITAYREHQRSSATPGQTVVMNTYPSAAQPYSVQSHHYSQGQSHQAYNNPQMYNSNRPPKFRH